MGKPFYLLGDDNWKWIEENGFLAIPVWGGIVVSKPGYVSLLFDHESPKVRHVSDSEIDDLIHLRDLHGFKEEY
ncbi:MAG: hypothetical protein ACTSRU_19860 [Candidatus Hodarchaeales archaeon]